ncbi:MAG: hypothetical protein ACXVNM_12535, partial [Bacteroidia bacterium]
MRNFFIIGHNPNTVANAINYLKEGANALEPDVHFTNGDYYLGEGTTSTDLSLATYLQGLTKELKVNPAYTPALIMFDTKNSNGSILDLLKCIQTNFSSQFSSTAILITRSQAQGDEHDFFSPAAGQLAVNAAVGVDEYTHPEEADAFFKSMNISNYTFADGLSIQVPLLIEFFWRKIKHAVELRDQGNSFKMVYTWTLDRPMDIHSFLKLNTDGMITDNPATLKEMLLSPQYSEQYKIA